MVGLGCSWVVATGCWATGLLGCQGCLTVLGSTCAGFVVGLGCSWVVGLLGCWAVVAFCCWAVVGFRV